MSSMFLVLPPHERAHPPPPLLTLTARVSCSSHAGFTGVHDQFATQERGDAPHRPVKSVWPLSPFRFSKVGEEIGEETECGGTGAVGEADRSSRAAHEKSRIPHCAQGDPAIIGVRGMVAASRGFYIPGLVR